MWYWLILAGVLFAAEMLSGTFALLFAGLGALLAALLASALPDSLAAQITLFALGVLAGAAVFIKRLRAGKIPEKDESCGQSVEVVETRASGSLRVRYRGTEWEARFIPEDAGDAAAAEKETLYIHGREGSVLLLSRNPPAP